MNKYLYYLSVFFSSLLFIGIMFSSFMFLFFDGNLFKFGTLLAYIIDERRKGLQTGYRILCGSKPADPK